MNLTHIDTCFPCFLGDHHNRDGEALLSVPVDGSTTVNDVMESLHYEVQSHDFPDGFDYDAAEQAVKSAFHATNRFGVWDDTLTVADDEENEESVYAYFVLYYGE